MTLSWLNFFIFLFLLRLNYGGGRAGGPAGDTGHGWRRPQSVRQSPDGVEKQAKVMWVWSLTSVWFVRWETRIRYSQTDKTGGLTSLSILFNYFFFAVAATLKSEKCKAAELTRPTTVPQQTRSDITNQTIKPQSGVQFPHRSEIMSPRHTNR